MKNIKESLLVNLPIWIMWFTLLAAVCGWQAKYLQGAPGDMVASIDYWSPYMVESQSLASAPAIDSGVRYLASSEKVKQA